MTQMMHSGWFIVVVVAALVVMCVGYLLVRVLGSRTQSHEQAAARTLSRRSTRTTSTKHR